MQYIADSSCHPFLNVHARSIEGNCGSCKQDLNSPYYFARSIAPLRYGYTSKKSGNTSGD